MSINGVDQPCLPAGLRLSVLVVQVQCTGKNPVVHIRTMAYNCTYMIKHLTKQGNSAAIVLDKPLLEATGIDASTPLEVSTNGDVILIAPVRTKKRQSKLKALVDDAHQRYAGVFRRLAK